MSLFTTWLDGMLGRTEQHLIDPMALWGRGENVGVPVHAGVDVTQASALRLSVVYRCIRLISESIASLPIDIMRMSGGVHEPVDRTPGWLNNPNPESNIFEFKERLQESLLMDGNAFVGITARDQNGWPMELWALDPRQMQVRRVRDLGALTPPANTAQGDIVFVWAGDQVLSRYGPSNPMGDVLHIRLGTGGALRGISPIDAARQAIGLGLVTEKFGAKFFGSGQQLSGVIQLPAGSPAMTRDQIELMRENWSAAHSGSDRAHRPAILTMGATWQGISITNEQAQFLDTRRFQVEDIASRIYGVPAHMVGLEQKNTSWGTGIEAQATGFVRFTLMPHIVRLETALSSLIPRGQYVKFNQRALVRADSATEAEVLVKMVLNGLMSRDEARALLDLAPVPLGSKFLIPLNEQVVGTPPPAPVPAPVTGNAQSNGGNQ